MKYFRPNQALHDLNKLEIFLQNPLGCYMEKVDCYESYPIWIVFISNLLSVLIYLIGAFIIYQIGIIWLIIYLCYLIFLEIRLLKKGCIDCYYFGKTCAFGKGRISRLFFEKGDSKRFGQKKAGWKDILPDLIVALVPAVICIFLLFINFNLLLLSLLILLILLSSFGNGFVRGKLACKYCKQRELGCPAEQLFQKAEKTK